MSCAPDTDGEVDIADDVAAAAFRRLVRHLRHRSDAQNIDLMGLAGFCRNCLADWIMEADGEMSREEARLKIYGMDYGEYKSRFQTEASPEQLEKMKQSVAKNPA